jgi:AraC-like DNA-binding protein
MDVRALEIKISDIDELQRVAHEVLKWDLKRFQLQKMISASEYRVLVTPDVQIVFSNHSMKFRQQGEVSKGMTVFEFVEDGNEKISQGNRLSSDQFFVMRDNSEHDIMFTQPTKTYMVSVDTKAFVSFYENRFLEPFPALNHAEVFDFPFRHLFKKYRLYFKNILQYSLLHTEYTKDPLKVINIEETTKLFMSTLLWLGNTSGKQPKWIDTAQTIYEVLNKNVHSDLTIEQFFRDMKISPRTSYHTFNKLYHITPKQYILGLKMSEARRLLMTHEGSQMMIKSIAKRYGFTHMSNFSKTYQQYFNELPHETLLNTKNKYQNNR